MGDIRSFFGGKPAADAKTSASNRRKRVVTDSDEDNAPSPKRPATLKAVEESRDTNASDYFASSKTKATRQNGETNDHTVKSKPSPAKAESTPVSSKSTPRKAARNGTRTSTRQKSLRSRDEDSVELAEDQRGVPGDDDLPDGFKGESISEDDVPKLQKAKPKAKPKVTSKAKRKSLTSDSEELAVTAKKPKKAAPSKEKPAAATQPDSREQDSAAKAIIDSITTIRAPSPPPPEDDAGDGKKKFPFGGHANSGPPPAADSRELPVGAENCLAGLSFVFTGLLQTRGREEMQSLVKQYGGKVVGAPSKKTDFVILGTDAGPSKLRKIKDLGLKSINEDGLFQLIERLPANGGDGEAAVQAAERQKKEEAKIEAAALEMEAQEKSAQKAAQKSKLPTANGATPPDTRLWTVKYAPSQLSQICGNKAQVEKLQRWLNAFEKNQRTGFRLAGKDGTGVYRAIMIHGPPGIGKTTAAHLVAAAEGYDLVESNASDTRSKKLVDTGLKGILDTKSLLGYFAGDGKRVDASKRKLMLVMDEVDGMSAGDRGGVGALAAVCKKTNIPMILICNDRKQPKMKPFDGCTYDLPFRRPTTDMIKSRIMTIMYRENMKLPPPVVQAIIEGTGADLRQIVNMISTVKLDDYALDFDDGKKMSKAWEKHVVLKPWDIVSKILGGGMFAPASKATLNDKIELYFNDHEFSYLMLQENYLGTQPIMAGHEPSERQKKLKQLMLTSQAADSISDGDLVDRMIHGSQQQWSLMPAHAVFSFVRPASFISGSLAGHQTRFTSWLGKNSAQNKSVRLVKEIQGHVRLRTTGDRHEIRQQYLPVLWVQLAKKLQDQGREAVDAIISLMDSYFLTKDDFDSILELGIGPMDMDKLKIDSAAKSAFTREYNKREHPISFLKASTVVAPKSKTREQPDLEEAIEESEDEAVNIKEEDDDEDQDLSKDKYIKLPKKKTAKKGESEDKETTAKPKKKAATAKAKSKK